MVVMGERGKRRGGCGEMEMKIPQSLAAGAVNEMGRVSSGTRVQKGRRKSICTLWALPSGAATSTRSHTHTNTHSVTESGNVTVCVCPGLTGATRRWCKRASDEPRISCQGRGAPRSSPRIASTPICLMSEKARTRSREIHIQYGRCVWCDTHTHTHTHTHTLTTQVFLCPWDTSTHTHTLKSSPLSMHAHTHKQDNESRSDHPHWISGENRFQSAGLMRGRKTLAHLSPCTPLLLRLIKWSEGRGEDRTEIGVKRRRGGRGERGWWRGMKKEQKRKGTKKKKKQREEEEKDVAAKKVELCLMKEEEEDDTSLLENQ